MPDQDRNLAVFAIQEFDRREQVVNVGREVRVRELALALSQTGEVEAQHCDALIIEGARDVAGCPEVLRAGEAMCEQRIRHGLFGGQIQDARQGLSMAVVELHFQILHNGSTCVFIVV